MFSILDCPRKFDATYVRGIESPHAPFKILGIVIHYMLDRFFKTNYKSRESFIKQGMGFWGRIIDGEIGPQSFAKKGNPPIEVAFGDKDPGVFFGLIRKALGEFWERNVRFRENLTPVTEQHMSMWHDRLYLSGKIDRVQPTPTGQEVWDYKPYTPDKFALANDIQMTLYDYWFRTQHGFPPEQLGIYGYFNKKDVMKYAPAREQHHFDRVFRLLAEAAEYVRCITVGEAWEPWNIDGFSVFHERDIIEGNMRRKALMGQQCKLCDYQDFCGKMERKELPTTREFFRQEYLSVPTPNPELIPERPAEERRKKKLRSELQQRQNDPLANYGKPEQRMLALKPTPTKLSDSIKPTKYGRCANCGYSLSKAGKCSNCKAWYDADGNYLPEKTMKSISASLKHRREKNDHTGGSPVPSG